MHLTCFEGYVVTAGGCGADAHDLRARGDAARGRNGRLVHAGTIHRLVNEGDLRITVLMQNSGLPAGG